MTTGAPSWGEKDEPAAEPGGSNTNGGRGRRSVVLAGAANLFRRIFPQPDLQRGERASWTSTALLCRKRTTVGGTLSLTQRRLIFVPNKLNLPRRAPLSVPLTAIDAFGRQKRNWQPYNGGFHNRLRFELRDRPPLLFVVRPLDPVMDELVKLLPGAGRLSGSPSSGAGTAVPTTSESTRSASRLTAPCPLRTRPRITSTGAWRATCSSGPKRHGRRRR